MRNVILWVLQVVFGLYFVFVGIMHFIVPDGLPELMSWMYDLSDTLHIVSGTAEILGGIGLILPSVTRIRPELTVYAAVGLVIVMVGAAIWHISRGEPASVVNNLVLAALLAYIAYGRWRLEPIPDRDATVAV